MENDGDMLNSPEFFPEFVMEKAIGTSSITQHSGGFWFLVGFYPWRLSFSDFRIFGK